MSLGTSNRDGGKTSESGHLRALGKIVSGDVIAGLNAVQRAAGINMSVDIQVGDAFVRRSDGTYAHPVFNDAVYNQVISAADGSNPRRDIVVIYVDYGQTPSTAVSNNTNGVVKIKVVNGTPAGSPVDPDGAALQASVGSGNPYSILARVRVPAGQTSISNSLIDDLRTLITNLANTVNTAALIDLATTTAKIADGSITNAKLSTTAGEPGGAWKSWTPTFTNLSGGTLNYAVYTKIGKTVHARLKYTATANSNFNATPMLFTLPVTSVAYGADAMLESSGIATNLTTVYAPAFVYTNTTTVVRVVTAAVSGTNTIYQNITSTTPMSWASGNYFQVAFTYEAA